jgi:hypothetical protein
MSISPASFFAVAMTTQLVAHSCSTPTTPTPAAPPPPAVDVCDTTPIDSVDVDAVSVLGDVLTVTVSYSGGCGTHDFEACWNGGWIKTLPLGVDLAIVHDGNGDACRQYITADLEYDLADLGDEAVAAFPSTTEVILHVDDLDVSYLP